ncbi:MAG: hypothetical protein IJ702_01020 [Fretibacterium sp.]|nr:hypothetical protein [Fretibacterium sp.]
MPKKRKRPETKRWRDYLPKVKFLATALFFLAHFILIVLEIIKVWNELAG